MTDDRDAPGKDGPAGTGAGESGAGESGGGAYPNPHTGKAPEGGGFMGHGGQTDIAYSGTGDADTDRDVGNDNAVTKE